MRRNKVVARQKTYQAGHRAELGQRRCVANGLRYEHACHGEASEQVASKADIMVRFYPEGKEHDLKLGLQGEAIIRYPLYGRDVVFYSRSPFWFFSCLA